MKIERNGPCPCGSGKKYKKCCKDLRSLLGIVEDDKKTPNPNIGKKEAQLADLLGLFVNQELMHNDLLNLRRDDEIYTPETKKLMKGFANTADKLEEKFDDWRTDYGISEQDEDIDSQENEDGYQGCEPEPYYDHLEQQYGETKEQGLFEVLKIMELDKKHSDRHFLDAVNHFKKANGEIDKDAPIDFLNKYEQRMVTKNGKFRADLYSMLLSTKFTTLLKEKEIFINHSAKYSY
ncbi:MAG: SEC-C domain-containing protein [Candidatus Brocadiales bacterium]|nr:SEC-C domain-containing protein [Candidatus Brocadiales bacterium]